MLGIGLSSVLLNKNNSLFDGRLRLLHEVLRVAALIGLSFAEAFARISSCSDVCWVLMLDRGRFVSWDGVVFVYQHLAERGSGVVRARALLSRSLQA